MLYICPTCGCLFEEPNYYKDWEGDATIPNGINEIEIGICPECRDEDYEEFTLASATSVMNDFLKDIIKYDDIELARKHARVVKNILDELNEQIDFL